MNRIAILPYGPSNSCGVLRDALVTALEDIPNARVVLLRSGSNSSFRGRRGDIVINYGNRSASAEVFGQAVVLNNQASLNNAANKLNALTVMRDAGVSVIPFTTSREQAASWAAQGEVPVYARTVLNGHSGEGIQVCGPDSVGPLFPQAPLYTKGITGRRREWRVHVFNGVITHVQVKRRRNGYQDDPTYREDVRNHSTGWIYATENINPSDAVLRNAVAAVSAMNLNFGAVDVISKNDDAWILEVNTAAGLQADTTLDAFVTSINAQVRHLLLNEPLNIPARFATPPTEVPNSVEDVLEVIEDGELFTPEAAPEVGRNRAAPRAPQAPATPRPVPTQVEDLGAESMVSHMAHRNLVDGYYLGDVRLSTNDTWASNVILWVSNNLVYRHGWNHPISSNDVQHLVKIDQVTAANRPVPVL